MRFRFRFAYFSLIILFGCAPGLIAQTFCMSGVATSSNTLFNVGDPIEITLAVTPGTGSCTTSPITSTDNEGNPVIIGSQTACTGTVSSYMSSGTQNWTPYTNPFLGSFSLAETGQTFFASALGTRHGCRFRDYFHKCQPCAIRTIVTDTAIRSVGRKHCLCLFHAHQSVCRGYVATNNNNT